MASKRKYGYLEPLLTIGSAAGAEPLAGLYGLLGGGADGVHKVRNALTYMPRTEEGSKSLQYLGDTIDRVASQPTIRGLLDGYNGAVDAAGDYSPVIGAALRTLPTALTTMISPGARGAFRSAGMAAERGLDAPVTSALNRGGLLGEMTQAMGTGGQSNMARMSAAEAVAKGYWHPIGDGKKLQVPVGDMTASTSQIPGVTPRKIISPESLLGSRLVPATGDRTAAGRMLNEVNGVKFQNPLELEGGPDFMRTHDPFGASWASGKGVITSLSNKVRAAADGGKDVYMPYVAMGHGATDFNTMMSDALLEQVRSGKITKKLKREFDQEVRALRPEFLGVDHPDVKKQLDSSGALRHAFNNRMELEKFASKGFPDITSTRFAITEPSLLDAPLHSTGFTIAKMDPTGRIIRDPVKPHSTYDTQLAGSYAGGFEVPIPRSIMFSDHYKARRAAGAPVASDPRAFALSNPVQDATQEWLDGVMKHIEEQKKLLGR